MAIISSYPVSTPQLGDKILGSNTVDASGAPVIGNPTVQYNFTDVKALIDQSYIQKLSARNETTFSPGNNNAGVVITFGAAQNVLIDDVMIDAAGKVTFNAIGSYMIQQVYYAKSAAANADNSLFFKTVKNGAGQEGPTSFIRFSTTAVNRRIPVNIQSYVNITEIGTYYNFHIQNPLSSAETNLGFQAVSAGFGTIVPSAQLIITKLQ